MSNKLINCKTCGQEISASAKVCPSCGAKNKKPIYKKWWFYLSIVVAVAIIAGSIGNTVNVVSTKDAGSKKSSTSFAKKTNEKNTDDSSNIITLSDKTVSKGTTLQKTSKAETPKSEENTSLKEETKPTEKMLNGANQNFNKDYGTCLAFRSEAPMSTFESVKIDGKIVDSSKYKVSEGSTIITFNDSYSTQLEIGPHTIEINSYLSSAQAPFTVSSGSSYAANDTVPTGCTYKRGSTTYSAGKEMPTPAKVGDTFTTTDYTYTCEGVTDASGWHPETISKTKATYEDIYDVVNGVGVWNLNDCFSDCVNLTTVPHLPESTIYMSATFQGCTSLTTTPVLPNSVTSLYRCFKGCTKLTDVSNFSENIYIGKALKETFAGCTKLVNVPSVPSGVKNISEAFRECTSLETTPTLPNSIENMRTAFYKCSSLKTITNIPENVTNISEAFAYTAITSVSSLPNKIENGYLAFGNCKELTTAPSTLPNTLTSVEGMFTGCSKLTSVPNIPVGVTKASNYCSYTKITTAPTISNTVTNIEGFCGACTQLTQATAIPSSVINGKYAFSGCTSLSGSIEVNTDFTEYSKTYYDNFIKNTQITSITGSTTLKTELLATK